MSALDHHTNERIAIRTDLGAIFVSLELSRSVWLVTSLSPGGGEKMSKYSIRGGETPGNLARQSADRALATVAVIIADKWQGRR